MEESEHPEDSRAAIEEAAEHADRAAEEREEMRRKASLAEAADDAQQAGELEREAEVHREESYEHEDAAADRARDA